MKNSAFFIIAFFVLPFFAQAQGKVGIRAGLSTTNLDKEKIEQNGLSLAIKDAQYGFHIGVFGRVPLGDKWYLQPEVLFNSTAVDFDVTDISDGLVNTVLTEKYQNLDMPLMLGYKIGPLRLEGGPTGHVFLKSKSDIEDDVTGYKQRFKDFNLGYQAGLGFDILRVMIDVRYEGNFNNFGEHMTISGEQINFSQNPSRWVVTAGFAF